ALLVVIRSSIGEAEDAVLQRGHVLGRDLADCFAGHGLEEADVVAPGGVPGLNPRLFRLVEPGVGEVVVGDEQFAVSVPVDVALRRAALYAGYAAFTDAGGELLGNAPGCTGPTDDQEQHVAPGQAALLDQLLGERLRIEPVDHHAGHAVADDVVDTRRVDDL